MLDNREITKRIKLINSRIALFSAVKSKPIRHILAASGLASGKRIRGLLVLLAGELFTGKITKELLDTAAAIELFHHATLIHDDIIDNSEKRRGAPAMNRTVGYQLSVLAGDYFFSRVLESILKSGKSEMFPVFAGFVRAVCEGEIEESFYKGRAELPEKVYLNIIKNKTAALIEGSVKTGAIAAGAPASAVKKLASFGYNLGMAFQIKDDILDLTSSDRKLGKTAGNDLREGRATLPFILAFRRAPAGQRVKVRNFFKNGQKTTKIVGFIKDFKGIEAAEERSMQYVAEAKKALAGVRAKNISKKILLERLSDYIIIRNY